MNKLQLGLSLAAMVMFGLITAYWMVTPEPERLWIPILLAATFAMIAFQEWRKGQAKLKADQKSSKVAPDE